MLTKLFESLGFRKSDSADQFLEQYSQLSPDQKEAIIDTYIKQGVCPDSPGADINQKALQMWRLGHRQKALDYYNQAIVIAPNDAVLLLNRANLQVELGNVSEALHDYERARCGQPALPDRLFTMQRLLQNVTPRALNAFIAERKKS